MVVFAALSSKAKAAFSAAVFAVARASFSFLIILQGPRESHDGGNALLGGIDGQEEREIHPLGGLELERGELGQVRWDAFELLALCFLVGWVWLVLVVREECVSVVVQLDLI